LVESDLEGPWVKADHAFDVVARGIPDGARLFRVLSTYDDVRFFVEKAPGYEPGDTLMLVAPFLLAHGADDRFLRSVASQPENTRLIDGAVKSIDYLRRNGDFYLISTSYEQYVETAADLLRVPRSNVFCTEFPIDWLARRAKEEDLEMIRGWTARIAAMPPIEISESGVVKDECMEAKEILDEFFWELLPGTSLGEVLESVRPVGGRRKLEALLEALQKEGRDLSQAAVIGDSITDSVMLEEARDAGALALSFNGNRYSIANSNVAVISSSCWGTAAVVRIYSEGGLDMVEEIAGNWGPEKAGELEREGILDPPVALELEALSRKGVFPEIHWVGATDLGRLVARSEEHRRKVRGTSIGELG
jgi:energy-converting hydrogenase A subunit R